MFNQDIMALSAYDHEISNIIEPNRLRKCRNFSSNKGEAMMKGYHVRYLVYVAAKHTVVFFNFRADSHI